jgi:hypothetical protein
VRSIGSLLPGRYLVTIESAAQAESEVLDIGINHCPARQSERRSDAKQKRDVFWVDSRESDEPRRGDAHH